jgi:hypothetical protein
MSVIDITVPVKKKRKTKNSGDQPPGPPKWEEPSKFPDHAASILKKNRISKRQFGKYVEQLSLFLLSNCSADFAITVQRMIRNGDKTGMDMFAKAIGLVKNESGVVVNLQNNLAVDARTTDKSFDSLVRLLDDRDRKAQVVEVAPVAQMIEE